MNELVLCVGSKNPIKVSAAQKSFESLFPEHDIRVISVDAPSGVPDQPMTTDETLAGAINRVKFCQSNTDANYYLSYEGGVDVIDGIESTYAVVCIANAKRLQTGRTGTLPLPPKIYQQLLSGMELGDAMDELFSTKNIKQKGGAIGQLTNGLCTREGIYMSATVMTLTAFIHTDLY